MNKKAELFDKFLAEAKIDCFGKEEVQREAKAPNGKVSQVPDPLHLVLYHSSLEVEGQALPFLIALDDSMYNMVQVLVSRGTVTDDNRTAVHSYLNEMNKRFKVFKYYTDDGNNICLDSCICSTEEHFDPSAVTTVLNVIMEHLKKEYPALMKRIWSN
jgi:deoxyadenosine/deoxycytidine kinase